jgi:hypothetical protein
MEMLTNLQMKILFTQEIIIYIGSDEQGNSNQYHRRKLLFTQEIIIYIGTDEQVLKKETLIHLHRKLLFT